MKKLLLTAVALIGLFGNQAQAQNSTKKWYVSTGAHAVNHNSVRGMFDQFFVTDNWSPVPLPSQLTIARTLNRSFAVDVQASIGEVDNFRLDHNNEFMALVGAGLRYKLTNGYILKEESWFDPYLRAGANFYRHPYRGIHFDGGQDVAGEIMGNEQNAHNNFFAVSGGAGINFWIWQKVGLNIETQYVWTPAMESDYIDFFQVKAGLAFRFGEKVCKDRDKDGVCDDEDVCPDEPGIRTDDPRTNGCPDKDKDGVFDFEDACPDEFGLVEFQGCPDRDGDKIIDKDDKCPDEACPEGFETSEYTCEQGCKVEKPKPIEPEVVTPEPVIIPEFNNVLFEYNKSELTVEGKESAKIAADIIKQKGGNYFVDGFADSVGSDKYNINLSKKRAEAVRQALIAEGIKPEQLEVRAFGEQYPKCTNDTDEGRACNRRVVVIEKY